MKKKLAISVFAVVLLSTIAMFWLRVRSLEKTLESLNKRLQNNPTVVTVGEAKSNDSSEHKPVFKLIESAKHTEQNSNVGVPWDVERAIMGGARESEIMRGESIRVEMSPAAPTIESPAQPRMNLDFLNRDTGSN